KLQHLDDYHRLRQEAASWYDTSLFSIEGLQTPVRSPFTTHIFHQYTLQVEASRRDALKQWLMEKGIPSQVYYPVPLHLQQAYRDLGYGKGSLPASEELCNKVLSLPIHTEMEQKQLEYISEQVQQFFKA
ncbi:MAG: DegT/DnrJ/EryC1/StrS family aminotransferase, partial [Bacteroidales bacterium]|nr:DegT/DnrJ/EryC1/StrS family aminotransferase [Bacteroidales bacterium]